MQYQANCGIILSSGIFVEEIESGHSASLISTPLQTASRLPCQGSNFNFNFCQHKTTESLDEYHVYD